MIIHQVFIPMFYKAIDDNPTWKNARLFNEMKRYKIKVWNKQDILNLIKNVYSEFLDFVCTFPNDYWLTDFCRSLILHKHGGIYLDLDCKLMTKPDLDKNQVGYFYNPKKHLYEINNDFIYFKDKNLYLEYARFCVIRGQNNKMPKNWLCRRMLSIVSANAMKAFVKQNSNIEMFKGYDRGTDKNDIETWLKQKELSPNR